MAVTKLWAIKTNLKKSIDYIKNPAKTDGCLLVSGFKVAPNSAYIEYQMTEEIAKSVVGDYSKGKGNLAYHVIQSFNINDKITPEAAHEIGKNLADQFLEGKYEYVVSTHKDKKHIHNHIVFNAVSFKDYHKFNSQPYITAGHLRTVSDKLCLENGLDVIKHPKGKGKCYKEWMEDKKGTSWKSLLRNKIDEFITKANDYQEFLQLMQGAGYEIKFGKHIAFRAADQQRFTRAKTLGTDYTEENIKSRIESKQLDIAAPGTAYKEVTINKKLILGETDTAFFTRLPYTQNYLWLSKDVAKWDDNKTTVFATLDENIEYSICTKDGSLLGIFKGSQVKEYYDNAAEIRDARQKGRNLSGLSEARKVPYPLDKKLYFMARKQQIADVKALANTLVLLRKENILKFSDFDSKLEDLRGKRKEIKEDIKKLDIKNTAYKEVAKYLVAYNKNLPVFEEYQKKLFGNKTFYKKHESEIRIFEHAKNRLEEMKINTNVNSEKVVAVVKSQNKDIYNLEADFKKIDNRINDLSSARKTVENILLGSPDDKKKSRGREEERD